MPVAKRVDTVYTYTVIGDDGKEYVEEVDIPEWDAYLPTVIAVLESGAIDHWLYVLARAAKRRHCTIEGLPIPKELYESEYEDENGEPEDNDWDNKPFSPMTPSDVPFGYLLDAQNKVTPNSWVKVGYFSYGGKRFSKQDLLNKYVILRGGLRIGKTSMDGALIRIEGVLTANVTIRIVSAGKYANQKFKMPFLHIAHALDLS